jgi:hypothetical protein
MSRVRATTVLVEKQKVLYILSMFVALTLHHIVMCGLPRSAIFFYFIKSTAGFSKKKSFIESRNMCFDFLYKVYMKHYSIQEELREI